MSINHLEYPSSKMEIRLKPGRFFIAGKEREDILSWKVFCRLFKVSCLHIINTIGLVKAKTDAFFSAEVGMGRAVFG